MPIAASTWLRWIAPLWHAAPAAAAKPAKSSRTRSVSAGIPGNRTCECETRRSAVAAVTVALTRARRRWWTGRAERLPRPVISVGNLLWGGGGKTPVTAAIAAHLRDLRPGSANDLRVAILSRGYGRDAPGLSSPGYRELAAHLAGDLPLDEAVRLIQRSHRRYARRQRTWFRKTPGLTWFSAADALPLDVL